MDNKNKKQERKVPPVKKSPKLPSQKKVVDSENKSQITAQKIFSRISLTLSKYMGKIVTYALNIFLTVLLIGIITGSAMACALVVYIKNYVDPVYDIDNLKTDSNLTTFIYYENKKEDGSKEWVEWEDERIHGTENRMWVSYDEMPEDLINAFVSIEDKRFFTHKGIDLRRTIGAVMEFVSGNDSYGGSTITQQLIKNVTGENDVTMQRKIQEILPIIDAVAEIVDARVPISSRNPDLLDIIKDKPLMILLNKCDMADPKETAKWIDYYRSIGVSAVPIDCKTGKGIGNFKEMVKAALADKLEVFKSKGMVGKPLRVMVVGIPNVGKSTFINSIAGKGRVKVENRPANGLLLRVRLRTLFLI